MTDGRTADIRMSCTTGIVCYETNRNRCGRSHPRRM